jgi:Leucine-rich repeat (LRR) protein
MKMSEEALKRIRIAKAKRLTKLDLREVGLIKLPKELSELVWLEELDISDNRQLEDIRYLNGLANLTRLNIAQSQLYDIYPLSGLSNLQHLIFGSHNIAFLRDIAELIGLTHLSLRCNDIRDVQPLEKLVNLTQLELIGRYIDDLRPLAGLVNLTKLAVLSGEICDISPLKHMIKLTELSISSGCISDFYPLKGLINLTHLSLQNNKISDLRPFVNLSNLKHLNVVLNEISDLHSLMGLVNITELAISRNQLKDIDLLSNLENLTHLHINHNYIDSLEPIVGLIEKGIPVRLQGKLDGKPEITVGDNPLLHPPLHIVEQGNAAILAYFRDLDAQGAGKLNEAKLIIVGEPAAGKTSLMEKLFDPDFTLSPDTESTLGITVREGWSFPHPTESERQFSANVWDFGGQQIQYMTHQFFLTPSSLYVLVSANDRKEPTNFPYWFKIIHLLGEERGFHSPVLVVLNEKDDRFINKFNFDRKFYQDRYPELTIEVCEVNLAQHDSKLNALRRTIQEMLVKLPHVNDDRPARWQDIRDSLRKRAKTADHISFDDYAAICVQHAVTAEDSQLLLSGYLHRLGSVLHFAADMQLRDFMVLNPQWAVDAVYSVLADNEIAAASGRFTQRKLDAVWAGYKVDERAKLLNLMKQDNFEICYPLADGGYIAPQLLCDQQPVYAWDDSDTLKFRFQYKFMPEGIVTRLIVRLNALIAKDANGKDVVWRKGVLVVDAGCQAQVREEENRDGLKVIDIAVTGEIHQRKYLLRRVRDEVQAIHQKWFRNIQSDQMIPCQCEHCQNPASSECKYFKFETLRKYQDNGKSTIECDQGLCDVPVSGLLEGVFPKEEIEQLQTRERFMSGHNISHVTVEAGGQLIVGDGNQQKSHSDNVTVSINAEQREFINALLETVLDQRPSKEVSKAAFKMQEMVEADKAQPTPASQNRLGRFFSTVRNLAGFTQDASKLTEFVVAHSDDIGSVLTAIF